MTIKREEEKKMESESLIKESIRKYFSDNRLFGKILCEKLFYYAQYIWESVLWERSYLIEDRHKLFSKYRSFLNNVDAIVERNVKNRCLKINLNQCSDGILDDYFYEKMELELIMNGTYNRSYNINWLFDCSYKNSKDGVLRVHMNIPYFREGYKQYLNGELMYCFCNAFNDSHGYSVDYLKDYQYPPYNKNKIIDSIKRICHYILFTETEEFRNEIYNGFSSVDSERLKNNNILTILRMTSIWDDFVDLERDLAYVKHHILNKEFDIMDVYGFIDVQFPKIDISKSSVSKWLTYHLDFFERWCISELHDLYEKYRRENIPSDFWIGHVNPCLCALDKANIDNYEQ